MANFVQRFIDIKTRIGGNREKHDFEFTFGTPIEMRSGITMPAAHIRRIIAETDFAIKLNAELGGKFNDCVDVALSTLALALDTDGAITRTAAAEAEEALLPMSDAAHEYEVLCAAHAHIDMNWMWGWQETVAATLSTFRTMLNLMKEYPEFKFSQSQASVYKIVEEYDPDMMREIQQRIQEGRWEVTASAWVETDKNMPDTESLIRHIAQTRKYMHEVWGVPGESLNIDFSPDTFGHSAFVPEIDAFGAVKYMYHCRGLTTKDVIYRWQAPSGAEVLVYREPYWYNSGITTDVGTGVIEISRCSGGLKTGLIVYGVGNHGGGATRRDVERIIEMQEWPVFPRVRFGSFGEYFKKAEAMRDNLTLRSGELNAIFTGCYTTQSRIKRGNRSSEAALMDAETLSALAGSSIPAERGDKAWRNVLFTHFHDILTGSCVQESREHAIGLLAESMAVAQTASSSAITRIGEHIDTSIYPLRDVEGTQSEGAGVGYGINVYAGVGMGIEAYAGVPNPERGRGRTRVYTVYNPCATVRDEVVEITVWDWPFDLGRIEVLGPDGKQLPHALITAEPEKYWDHLKIRLLTRVSVPALGYATLAVTERAADEYPTYRLADVRTEDVYSDAVMENEHLRAVFSRMDGALISLTDKADGRELIPEGKRGQLMLIDTESSSSDAWHIGRWLNAHPLSTVRITPSSNALRQSLEIEQDVLGSSVTTCVSLSAGAAALKYEFRVDWNECAKGDTVPVLVYNAPVSAGCMSRMDVPAGVIDREPKPQDLPALTFAAAVSGDRAAYLASDCKYGYRNWDGDLSVTLINSAGSPDPYPERGIHRITVWLGASQSDAAALKNAARLLSHPAQVCSTGIHAGTLPTCTSLMGFEAGSSVLSSLFRDGDEIVARVYELNGKADEIRMTIPSARSARLTDLDGRTVGAASVAGDEVKFAARAHGITQVVIEI